MQYSFYGGQQGKSFIVSQLFKNKAALVADINMRWSSSIGVGEFVFVSYGLVGDTTAYNENANIDKAQYGKTYNNTLWQKIYLEEGKDEEYYPYDDRHLELIFPDNNITYGIAYKMIAALTGNTPRIQVSTADPPLDADEKPYVTIDTTDVDNPVITFHLPQSQVIGLLDTKDIDADRDPSVTLDNSDINRPKLQFFLPKSQIIGLLETIELNADGKPSVFLDDDTDINRPKLQFSLPQSQLIGLHDTDVTPPQSLPDVDLDISDINNPKLTFHLPRGIKIIWGPLLGNKSQINYVVDATSEPSIRTLGLQQGDYYINESTGYVYLVTGVTNAADGETTAVDFKYLGCMRAPLPTVSTRQVDPYDSTGTTKTPISINSTFANPTEETGWSLQFSMPTIPDPSTTVSSIAPDDNPSASVHPTDSHTINFDFQLPRGSRIFAGTEIKDGDQTIVEDSLLDGTRITSQNGDTYINTETGILYILRRGVWMKQKGSLKGPKGDSLKTVLKLQYTSDNFPSADVNSKALDSVIEQEFRAEFGRLPNEDELIAVTWIDVSDGGHRDLSYWYFYVKDAETDIKEWGRVTLTGGVSDLFFDEYTTGPRALNKGYTAEYINGLIGGNLTTDRDKKTFSVEQILGMLEWGDFENADTDVFPPVAGDSDSLSATEILSLLQWGDMVDLNT